MMSFLPIIIVFGGIWLISRGTGRNNNNRNYDGDFLDNSCVITFPTSNSEDSEIYNQCQLSTSNYLGCGIFDNDRYIGCDGKFGSDSSDPNVW